MNLDVILCDLSAPLIRSWRSAFAVYENVEFFHGSIIDVAADAYASPANSFGIMDGGIDVVLSSRFPLVEMRVQDAIAARGEPLPVGECLIVETGDLDVPFLACAPTMLFPARVAHTHHAFLAMQAILREAIAHEGITSIAIPGLCTGVGEMHPDIAAEQMAEAYRVCSIQGTTL